jgi:hypothetical protein
LATQEWSQRRGIYLRGSNAGSLANVCRPRHPSQHLSGGEGTHWPIIPLIEAAAPQIAEPKTVETMAVQHTSGYFRFQPATKRQADLLAIKLFCLGSFILLGLIMAGVL